MTPLFKKFFQVSFFSSNVLVPIIALTIYCWSFAYFSSRSLLEGVSYVFASRLLKYALIVMVGAILMFFVLLKMKKSEDVVGIRDSKEKPYPGDFFLLLLPLTPVAQYILNNQDILSSEESFYLLGIFLVFSGLYIVAIPALLGIFMPTRTLMILGLAFVFTIVNMASLSDSFAWFESGSLRIQLMFMGGVFLTAWLLYNLNQRKILYLFILFNFISNSYVQLQNNNVEDASSLPVEENKLLSLVGERKPELTPNIYLLVYDSYVPHETMLAYGIDNSGQESYLSEQGFKLYPHTYSIGAATIASMSRVLNASTSYYGDWRRGVSGDGVTQRMLQKLGYKTYGLFYSDYMFRGIGESYDYSIPASTIPAYIQLLKAIFIGEFRFNIEEVGFNPQTRDQFVEGKQKIFGDPGNRIFIYMHTNLPAHTQNSGTCLPNETALYEERLIRANLEMRQDVDLIIQNDPDAIIIVAGDHGPHLTKNCYITTDVYDISEISRLDILDRHSTFLAIRWPTGDFVEYDDITVLQDLFPVIFAYLYKDETILESKIEPIIPVPNDISGASVNNGIIFGGINDGELLFLSDK